MPTPGYSACRESTLGFYFQWWDSGTHCHTFMVSRHRSELSFVRAFCKDNRTELCGLSVSSLESLLLIILPNLFPCQLCWSFLCFFSILCFTFLSFFFFKFYISLVVDSLCFTEICYNCSYQSYWPLVPGLIISCHTKHQEQDCKMQSFMCVCLVAQSCPTLCDPMDYSPPGSSYHRDSPGKNTGVSFHALLQGIFPT